MANPGPAPAVRFNNETAKRVDPTKRTFANKVQPCRQGETLNQ